MGQIVDRAEVMKILRASKLPADRASLYADAYLEYRAAQDNITAHGAIVADPRTGAPIPNPYLQVRDKAFTRLEQMHRAGVKAPLLWT